MDRVWPLQGREQELERIALGLRSKDVRGVVLVGRGGVGKTRLAAEAMTIAEQAGFATAAILATRAAASLPLGAFAPLLPATGTPGGDAMRRARDEVLALGGSAPLLLLIDDAHLLDPVSATLLLQLARDPRLFPVATVRAGEPVPDPITALWKDAGSVRLDIEPLDEAATEHLLRSVLGGPVATGSLQAVWDRSAGNPLALRELVDAGLGSGRLRQEGGIWHLVDPPPLTTRLTELIEDRLGALTGDERDAVALASLGEPVRLEVLGGLVGLEVIDHLDERGVLEIAAGPDGDVVRPAHPLYGEVAVQGLGTLRRRRLLGDLADAETARGPRNPTEVLRIATWRLGAGGDVDAGQLVEAAVVAYSRQDYRRTEELAQAAWERDPTPDAAHLLGFCLGREGRAEEAESLLARAAELATDDRMRALVAMARSENRYRGLADIEGAIAVNEAAERSVSDDTWRAELVANRAMFVMMAGRSAEALELVRPLLAPGVPDRPFVKAAYVAGPGLANDGQTAEALAVATRALPIHERVWAEDLFQTEPAVHHVTAILAQIEAGRLAEAETYAAVALRTASAIGAPYAVGFMAMLSGLVALRRGRVRTAGDRCLEAVLAFESSGYVAQQRWVLAGAAHSAALAGRVDEAEGLLGRVDDLADRTQVRFNEAVVDEARGWVLAAQGRPLEARLALSDAADRATAAGQRAAAASLLHSLARVGGAHEAVERLAVLAESIDGDLIGARVAHARSAAAGDGDALDEAAERFEGLGAHLWAAEASAAAVHAHRSMGRARAATKSANQAREQLAQCEGARTPALAGLDEITPLTRREREVALLASQGLASLEIADRLGVSRRTVDNHLQRAYDKLGVRRRRDLAGAIDSSPGST